MVQVALFAETCGCGRAAQTGGLCSNCYAKAWHDRHHFGGHREEVLDRDGRQCRGCEGRELLIVHHRTGEQSPAQMITLCARCHARVHRLQAIRYWLPPLLLTLWEEQHPNRPLQLQLAA